jgi:phosphohistidine phosphatase
MPTLYLMRHAKSDWHSTSQTDFDRPLNNRGSEDAVRVGQWLATQSLKPQVLLASPAQRARQTVQAVAGILGIKDHEVKFEPELYLASQSTLVNVLRVVADSTESILLVAHNPGMDELVEWLASEPPPLSDSGKLMTTAAIAMFELQDGWDNLKPGGATLQQLLRPREL